MAKESVSLFEVTDVQSSTVANNVEEKRYTALNGFDTALRKGTKLLVFSTSMKEEKRKNARGESYKAQFFWALDIERKKLVQPSRTSMAGGMGYSIAPKSGHWEKSADGKWFVLKPYEDDPALESMKQWGIGRILPGAFEYSSNHTIEVPRCFIIEVDTIEYLYSRNPVDVSSNADVQAREMADLNFKSEAARRWDGRAYYPTREEVKEIIDAYNECRMVPFDDTTIAELCK